MLPVIILALICTVGMMLLDEMWSMWDPYGRGINVHSWTLGIAMEIDAMINEFNEWKTMRVVQPHECVPEGEASAEKFWGISARAMSS